MLIADGRVNARRVRVEVRVAWVARPGVELLKRGRSDEVGTCGAAVDEGTVGKRPLGDLAGSAGDALRGLREVVDVHGVKRAADHVKFAAQRSALARVHAVYIEREIGVVRVGSLVSVADVVKSLRFFDSSVRATGEAVNIDEGNGDRAVAAAAVGAALVAGELGHHQLLVVGYRSPGLRAALGDAESDAVLEGGGGAAGEGPAVVDVVAGIVDALETELALVAGVVGANLHVVLAEGDLVGGGHDAEDIDGTSLQAVDDGVV